MDRRRFFGPWLGPTVLFRTLLPARGAVIILHPVLEPLGENWVWDCILQTHNAKQFPGGRSGFGDVFLVPAERI
jgi:hypothetical protein